MQLKSAKSGFLSWDDGRNLYLLVNSVFVACKLIWLIYFGEAMV